MLVLVVISLFTYFIAVRLQNDVILCRVGCSTLLTHHPPFRRCAPITISCAWTSLP